MKVLLLFIGWCLLFVVSGPLALLALLLAPLVWLLSLPFQLLGITLGAVFALAEGHPVPAGAPARRRSGLSLRSLRGITSAYSQCSRMKGCRQ
jgi:hypothetical protein